MGRITFTADEHHEDIITEVEAEDGVESQAAAVRECISRYADLQTREEELQRRVEELQQTVERLEDEKRLILAEREEKKELARYVEEERRAEQRWREAPLTTRLRWKIAGMPPAGDA